MIVHSQKIVSFLKGSLNVLFLKETTNLLQYRFHTLAYVASSGKLFSFGSGENGQLGNNKVMSVNSPVVVQNSWLKVKPENHLAVHRIAGGGDHCFILVSKIVSGYMYDTGNLLWGILTCVMSFSCNGEISIENKMNTSCSKSSRVGSGQEKVSQSVVLNLLSMWASREWAKCKSC